ncbi:hypothetical protein M405DRAFT_157343 [Rhizopogon salebrosus TDB-379]|nr:hypothetical protein M405DRAFT_157343 [Rhizopogon salebrosus TDB-379]
MGHTTRSISAVPCSPSAMSSTSVLATTCPPAAPPTFCALTWYLVWSLADRLVPAPPQSALPPHPTLVTTRSYDGKD